MCGKNFFVPVTSCFTLPKMIGRMKGLTGMAAQIVALTMAVSSCGLYEIGEVETDMLDGGIWGGPSDSADKTPDVVRRICYMTAFDYQKDYDWRADRSRESVKCSLIVYEDGRAIMKVPVGEEYETGSDPDMHRVIRGHLYTDYSTSTETVVKKDGAQIFRYPGKEAMCGMAVSGTDVYTLGADRDGNGFTYRKNGEILLSRENAAVMGNLKQDDDSLSFTFCERILSSEETVERYFAVMNGRVRQIAVRDDIVKVWDAVLCDGKEIYVASLVGVGAPVIYRNGQMTTLSMPENARILSITLLESRGALAVEALYSDGRDICSAFWSDDLTLVSFPPGRIVSAMCLLNRGVCCVLNPESAMQSGLIYRSGDDFDMPGRYSCMSDRAICMVDGILNVGLASYDGKEPVLWKDGQTETLKINGYISSITVE